MVSSDKFPVLYKLGLGKQGAVEKLSNPINIIQCIVEEEGEVRGTTLPARSCQHFLKPFFKGKNFAVE